MIEQLIRSTAPFRAILLLTLTLLAVSWLIAPSSVEGRQLSNTLFFASLLGLAALGQLIVILGGGIDLSIGPTVGLAGVIFANVAQTDDVGSIAAGASLGVLAGVCVGLANGAAVTLLRITPLIATLGVGALATGVSFSVIGDGTPKTVASSVSRFVTDRPILDEVSFITLIWAGVAGILALGLWRTIAGRTFMAVGSNVRSARTLGVRVDAYRAASYVVAGVLYAGLGLALTGLAGQPNVTLGDSYLLPSIAAVVVGGAVLGGGSGSIVATMLGAFFITQLDSVTLSLKASTGAQLIVQAAVIAIAMALYQLKRTKWPAWTKGVRPRPA